VSFPNLLCQPGKRGGPSHLGSSRRLGKQWLDSLVIFCFNLGDAAMGIIDHRQLTIRHTTMAGAVAPGVWTERERISWG